LKIGLIEAGPGPKAVVSGSMTTTAAQEKSIPHPRSYALSPASLQILGLEDEQEALEEERNEADLDELPRLVLRHRRRNFGRLRELINAVNSAELEA